VIVQLEADVSSSGGLRADAADRGLRVLRLDRRDHVVDRDAEARHALEVEPDAHRIVERAEHAGLADARHAGSVSSRLMVA
jgi:hypothetical protein